MKHSYNLIHPEAKTSSIRLSVSHNGKKYQRGTGLTIQTSLWNQKAKSLTAKCKQVEVRDELLKIDLRLTEKERTAKTERDVMAAIAYALGEYTPTPSSFSLWDYFKEWSERESPSKRFRQTAYKTISEMMGTADNWSDINGDWYFRFIRECDARGYSHNYKSTLTAKLKTVMNEAFDRGVHTNEAFRKFKTGYKAADTIALTQEEVDALWGAELSGRDAVARDCFIVGVYCAGRFQDYSQLSEDNVTDGKLRYTQRKTGESVVIPCSPKIREVFERNGGRVPKISEQEVNRRIKEICKSLGGSFEAVVEVRKSRGGRIVIEKHPRWSYVSCHTARRTGASMLYKAGVPILFCRFLTGHRNDTQFLNYIHYQKEEAVDVLAKSAFFK